MIKGTFICNHCKKEEVCSGVNDWMVLNEHYDIIYLPKEWTNLGKNTHLCKKCRKKFIKQKEQFIDGN